MNTLDEIIQRGTRLTQKEERALFSEYHVTRSRKTKTKIMESQYNQVHSIAMRFAKATGVDIDDLVSEGMIGLSDAIEIHNPEIGRLNTIAFKYITGYILRSIGKNTFGGKKQGEYSYNKRFDKAIEEIEAGANQEETAKKYGVTVFGIVSHKNGKAEKLSIDELESRTNETFQLESHYESPDKRFFDDELKCEIIKTLTRLSDRQADIIKLRYLHGMKFDDIAKIYNSNGNAIKSLMRKGFAILEKHKLSNLRAYLEA